MTPTETALPEILAAIAAALGEGWEPAPTEGQTWSHRLIHRPSDMGFHVSARGKPMRLSFYAEWPRGENGHTYSPFHAWDDYHITVAADRPPDKIASELRRRLLPQYEETHAKMTADRARHITATANRDAIAARLAALAGRKPGEHGSIRLFDDAFQCRSGDIAVDFDGAVNLELRGLSEQDAAEILRLLRKKP